MKVDEHQHDAEGGWNDRKNKRERIIGEVKSRGNQNCQDPETIAIHRRDCRVSDEIR